MSKVTGPNQTSGNVSGPLRKSSEYPATISMPQFLNAFDTNPKAQWASMGDEWQTDDSGVSQTTDQFFATRVKARIAGGKWLALAPVFFGGKQTSTKSPIGTNSPKVTVAFNLELANGTLTSSYTSPNTGGTVLNGTFMGATDGIIRPGDLLIGDFIYASAASLPYFEFTDRALLPWIRIAWSKGSASDSLWAATCTEYNAPWNCHYATCTSYATAKTLINTTGINNYNGGTDKWGSSDTTLPGCLGFIGIGLDGQKSLIFFGTSIMDGDGSGTKQQGGVDPANNLPSNYDTLGFPAAFAQNLSNQVPALNFGVGASSSDKIWAISGTAPDGWATNTEDIALQRNTIRKLIQYFDIAVMYDPQNDPVGTLLGCIYNHASAMRSANPKLKVYSVIVPNGYVNEAGATTAYDAGNLDPKYAHYATALAAGYIHGTLNLRESGSQIYADLGVQVSSTTTSNGSTTTLNDSGATWKKNQWINSFVQVGGVKKLISGNTRNQLTFAAFAGAVNSGTAYTIEGNTTGDGLHPNEVGQQQMGANFKTQIASYESIPYFTRTQ